MRIMTRTLAFFLAVVCADIAAGQDITAKQLLQSYRPRSRNVDIETPKGAELDKCKREIVKEGKGSSWVVYGTAGQVLRRFADTDGDGKVDQFRYYKLGVEVYRDIDSDGDEAIDQFRWLNAGGTRWGMDTTGDGKIDEWKRISAQEAAEVAVEAMIAGDDDLLATVLVTSADVRSLGLKDDYATAASESVSGAVAKRRAAARAKVFGKGSKWMRFDAQAPGLIPAGPVSSRDLIVYENAMAMVEVAGKPSLVHVGELVQIGNTWKLLNIPTAAEGDQIASRSVLMRPELQNVAEPIAGGVARSPEMQKLLKELQDLDGNAPKPSDGARAISRYNRARAGILAKLADKAPTASGKDEWTRQLADGIAAAVQTPGGWPEGLTRLRDLEKSIAADPKRSKTDILPYIVYRKLLAEYATKLQTANVAERQDAQDWWLEQLPKFARKYPSAPDAAEAFIELAKNQEFQGKLDEAEKSYNEVKKRHPRTPGGKLATGALRRLQLEGKRLSLSGTDFQKRKLDIAQYKNKVVLVAFWTTWCEPCKQELPQLIDLHAKYQRAGFEVLGVNLDDSTAPINAHLQKYKPRWNHIHDPGGMQGSLAEQFGIISLPTMFLVDKRGVVLSRSISLADLKESLPDVLKGKGLAKGEQAAKAQPPANTRRRARNKR
jgi:thiol-disulfide isomerase/thioredoxin